MTTAVMRHANRERRYHSAVFAVSAHLSVRLSVCLSQAGTVSKRLAEPSWFSAWKLPFTYPTLCYAEIRVSLKQG